MTTRLHSSAFSLLSDFDRENAVVERDYEAEIKSAFEEGYRHGHADGRTETEADAELRLTEVMALHSEQLFEEKQNWQRDCADLLAARLENVTKLIEASIEERVATLLRPWLVERLRERALQDLEKAIARALAEGAKVHIEAPAEILLRLRERLPIEGLQVGFSESQNSDIRAHIEETEIEVNISAWIAALEAVTS
ncbi:hypothetical protein [Hyphomicrobium sp. 99]|uniref:hypothetical protein n=1 Tax=Hyphomicrobium sp. 99 TaxID=1163419 RepID=UPI0005F77800|nr:hypothetical protein [Hyphomicrobium sp. 99]